MDNTLQAIALGGLALLSLVAVILLLVQRTQLHRALESARRDQQLLGDQLLDALDAQRMESSETLRALNDSLLNTLSAVTQHQTTLLEGSQRQALMTSRNLEERFGQMSDATARSLNQCAQNLEQLRQTQNQQFTALRQENEAQLNNIRRTVDEQLKQNLDKRLNDSFAQVSARLEQVYRGLGEMQSLAVGVGDLKKVLTNVKTRGIWGEMQLGALLSQMLAPEQYGENVAIVPGSRERVEFAVKLPGREGAAVWLPIDSKFPQEDYLRLVDASQQGDAAAVEAARKGLMTRLKTEGKRIADKYIAPPHSTDFAILFLPIEGLYAEVMRDMDVVEQLQRDQRVVVAGPSTFAALLNSLQMGFRSLAIEQRSSEVWKLLGAVKNDFARFADVLEKTQQRLRQATESIDTAFVRTRTIQRRLGQVEAADATLFSGEADFTLADTPEDAQ